MTEYIIIVVILAILLIAVVSEYGSTVEELFSNANSELGSIDDGGEGKPKD